jgi:hypothetical protein
MNTTQASEMVLKTDVLGRVKTPAARREQLLDEFEQSGLSGQKFAELLGLNYQTFATWAQKRRRAPPKVPTRTKDQVRWLEAVVEEAQKSGAPSSWALVLELPGGARVQMADVQQAPLAAALLRALEAKARSC